MTFMTFIGGAPVGASESRENINPSDTGDIVGAFACGRRLPGFYLEPALFTEAGNDMTIAREEIFGPVACVIRIRDDEEALSAANDTEFGLSAGICTTSLKHASHFRADAEAGMVMVNLPTAGVDYHVPFEGRKG